MDALSNTETSAKKKVKDIEETVFVSKCTLVYSNYLALGHQNGPSKFAVGLQLDCNGSVCDNENVRDFCGFN